MTYILEKRGGSSNSGYISSGFFGGKLAFVPRRRGNFSNDSWRDYPWPCSSPVAKQGGRTIPHAAYQPNAFWIVAWRAESPFPLRNAVHRVSQVAVLSNTPSQEVLMLCVRSGWK